MLIFSVKPRYVTTWLNFRYHWWKIWDHIVTSLVCEPCSLFLLFKTFRLKYINFFTKLSFKKNLFRHPFYATLNRNGYQCNGNSKRVFWGNWTESLVIINHFMLSIPLSHQSCLITLTFPLESFLVYIPICT